MFFSGGVILLILGAVTSNPFNFKDHTMNAHVKSYLWFIGFLAITKLIVAPVAKQLNVPMVSDVLG